MEASGKKEIAISFLRLASSGQLDDAYRKVSAQFRHHNPYFAGDAESLKAGMAEAAKRFPHTTLEVQRVSAKATWWRCTLACRMDLTSRRFR